MIKWIELAQNPINDIFVGKKDVNLKTAGVRWFIAKFRIFSERFHTLASTKETTNTEFENGLQLIFEESKKGDYSRVGHCNYHNNCFIFRLKLFLHVIFKFCDVFGSFYENLDALSWPNFYT